MAAQTSAKLKPTVLDWGGTQAARTWRSLTKHYGQQNHLTGVLRNQKAMEHRLFRYFLSL